MLKFTSVSGSVRAITDITLTGTIIRTRITRDLIIDPITGRTTGTAAIVITAITIVTLIVTGTNLTGIATPGWLETISSQPNFFRGEPSLRRFSRSRQAVYFLTLAKAPVWRQGLCPAPRSGILFSTAELARVFPFASPFRFAAGAIVQLFDVPECSEIQTERAPVDLAGDPSREPRHLRRAS